jgi:hypothetical protein
MKEALYMIILDEDSWRPIRLRMLLLKDLLSTFIKSLAVSKERVETANLLYDTAK